MEFGLFSNGERGDMAAADTYDEDIYEIRVADRLGFTEAWISEHPSLPKRPDVVAAADIFIAKAAALTKRIKFGEAVRPIAIYHPVQVAIEAAMVDQLTRGRYMFGFGVGAPAADGMLQRGIGPREDDLMRDRMREAIDLITTCWTSDEPFDYDGAYWQGKGILTYPKPYQRPFPPVAVAASTTGSTAELAGRNGFLPIFSQYDEATHIRHLGESYEAGCEAVGRPVDRTAIRACRLVWVAETTEQAREELRPTITPYIERQKRSLGQRLNAELGPRATKIEISWDYLVDSGYYFIGDPDRVCELVTRHFEESGGFGTLLLVVGKNYGSRRQRARSMRLFMEECAPRLRQLDANRAAPS